MSLRIFSKVSTGVRCVSSFKSAISLDKLYPNSLEIKKFTPPVSEDKFSGYIPIGDLNITYSRSSGAGGQHVNTTETKVDVRFHVDTVKWISDDTKQKLLKKHITKITKDGYLVIRSEKTRYKHVNLADAMCRLRNMIYDLETPLEEMSLDTAEKMRKNKEKAARIRLMEKRNRSDTKMQRQNIL